MKIVQHDGLNFLLTNRLPRRLLSRWMRRFSRIRHPWVCGASLWAWRLFSDLDLSDAAEPRFASLHACFTRRLRDGARAFAAAPAVVASPCDAVVGAHGTVRGGTVLQVKGMPYPVAGLLGDDALAAALEGGSYVTLRLRSAMYHRFHAPGDARVSSVTHIHGDRWNVNPPALRRVGRLFCRNERAVLRLALASGHELVLVAVAAILVGGIRLHFLDLAANDRNGARRRYSCDTQVTKGDELGWFEHGSTIVLLVPAGFGLADGIAEGAVVQAGQALLHLPGAGLQRGRNCHATDKEAGPALR